MSSKVKIKVGKSVPIDISEYSTMPAGHSVGFIRFNKLIGAALESSLTTIAEENVGGNKLGFTSAYYYVGETVIEKIADT